MAVGTVRFLGHECVSLGNGAISLLVTRITDHSLTNQGLWPIETAPWAITQLKPGGVAILPQQVGPADPDGVQPNRTLALWPYTDIGSAHLNREVWEVRDDLSLDPGERDPALLIASLAAQMDIAAASPHLQEQSDDSLPRH
jgi:hypothetical protein